MNNNIHHTAIIDSSVKMGEGNVIGPYCVISGNVEIGNNNHFKSHVVIESQGKTSIGDGNIFFPFSAFCQPQDKKYKGEESSLVIGNNNVFREYSTANPGTEDGNMITKIGNNCLFMMSSHVAHDCEVGDHVILSNSVAIAGHVTVGDYAIIGGLSAVHQRTRIGEHAMIGGMSAVAGDVIPFGMVVGDRAYLSGINVVGLKRRGFKKDVMQSLRGLYDLIFAESTDKIFAERIKLAQEEFKHSDECLKMLDFIIQNSIASRSLCKPR